MNARELDAARAALRSRRELAAPVLDELDAVVGWLVFRGSLPASMSPYGRWDDEAVREILQSWLEERLLRGHLQQLLDRARTPEAFRRLASRSLRQWLINRRDRTYSQNLFARLRAMLDDPPFVRRQAAGRPQDTWWTLETAPRAPLFAGSDRELLSTAWSLGDFTLLRYSERHKLSPLLSADDLQRFVAGMLDASGAALTLGMLLRTLRDRFGLDDVVEQSLDQPDHELPIAGPDSVADSVILEQQAHAALSELTPRQRDVLSGTRAGETLEQLAARHRCAVATIHNERRRIGLILERLSEGPNERDELLKTLVDLLYEHNE